MAKTYKRYKCNKCNNIFKEPHEIVGSEISSYECPFCESRDFKRIRLPVPQRTVQERLARIEKFLDIAGILNLDD